MIEKIIIISLFTIGYCCTFWEGMIFERVGNWLETHLPEWVNKPTWQCYICTCFWLGTALYWIVWHNNVVEWLLCVIPAMGLNAVISEFTNKEQEAKEVLCYGICPECKERCYPIESGDGFIYCNKCGAKY